METTKFKGHRNPPKPPKPQIEKIETVSLDDLKSVIVTMLEGFKYVTMNDFIIVDKKGNIIKDAVLDIRPDHKSIVHDYVVPKLKSLNIDVDFE